MAGKTEIFLRSVQRSAGLGNIDSANYQVLHGINKRTKGNLVAPNLDKQAYVFFTKPGLNLHESNLLEAPKLQYLADDDPNSLNNAIKCYLMPKVNEPAIPELRNPIVTGIRSNIVDDKSPFISVLTNTCLSLNGWPDNVADYLLSPAGVGGEVYGIGDSFTEYKGDFDLTGVFANIEGDPVTTLLSASFEYSARVKNETMRPFSSAISGQFIDYSTRIYVLITDPSERWLQKIACTGYTLPGSVPESAAFNFDANTTYAQGNNEVSTSFKCFGAVYNDPAIIRWFNTTQEKYNPSMKEGIRQQTMTKISPAEKLRFNYRGYLRISQINELEWWVSNSEYASINGQVNQQGEIDDDV